MASQFNAGGRPSTPGIAPPPGAYLHVPTAVPEQLRSPGAPPCWLILSTEGTVVNAKFDPSPALTSFVTAFAKKARKRFDVNLGTPTAAGQPVAHVRVVTIDAGSRFLRYVLTLFAGKTCFEIEGTVTTEAGQQKPFHFRHKCSIGIFGGSSMGMLKLDAKVTAKKVARLL